MPPLVGSAVDHYRLVEQIGAGGMGVVYRAHDEKLDRDVALKVLSAGMIADAVSRRRFRHEALTLSSLSHPNIAVVHDFGTCDTFDYLVMEYVPGTTLSFRNGPLPERDVLRLGVQIARGLAAAHAAGVVHRDLKPGNIRVTPDGLLKILDFGLARRIVAGEDARTTSDGAGIAGEFEGTLPYAAPEQLRGDRPEARSDIYAAGAVLFEMATGRPPFVSRQVLRLADQIIHEPAPTPRSLNREISPGLDEVIVKALDKDPDRRYQSAREMAVDLERLIAPSTTAPQPPRQWRLWRWVAAAVVVAVMAGGAWFGRGRIGPAPPSAFQGSEWVLVGDFENRSGRRDLDLLGPLLATSIGGSQGVKVLDRQRSARTLELMQKPGSPIDEKTGLDICRRDGVEVLLAGSIEAGSGGATARAVVRAISARDGGVLFVETVDAPAGRDVKEVAANLAGRLTRSLRGASTRVRDLQPLEPVMSPSTDAVERYSQAVVLRNEGNAGEAEIRLKGALELDPEFAMAHALLAKIYRDAGRQGEQQQQFRLAFEHRQRLDRRERLLVEGAYYTDQQRYGEARETLLRLVGIDANDWEARFELATASDNASQRAEAVKHMQEALRLNPNHPLVYAGLAGLLNLEARYDEASQVCQAATSKHLANPKLDLNCGLAAFGRLELAIARGHFERLARSGDATGPIYLVRIELFSGRLDRSAATLAAGIRSYRAAGSTYPERIERFLLARVRLLEGRRDEAVAEARAIAPDDEAVPAQQLGYAAQLYTDGGRLADARRIVQRLKKIEAVSGEAYPGFCRCVIEGRIARAERRWAAAEEAFRDAATRWSDYLPHQGLALVYEDTGRWAEAAREWERVVGPLRGTLFRNGFPPDWVLAQFALGRVYDRLDDAVHSRSALEAALDAWQDADTDLPDLRQGFDAWKALTGQPWRRETPPGPQAGKPVR
jgi:serine/threonine protein kinase/tetratricopeptide (TPR) repeat protein